MVRKLNNRLFKINTYASAMIVEVDDNQCVIKFFKVLETIM